MQPTTNFESFIQEMQNGLCDSLLNLINFKPIYDLESLSSLESVIEERYRLGHKPMITTLLPYGFYIGECLVRDIEGAHWNVDNAKNVFDFTISVPLKGEHVLIKPYEAIKTYWFNREKSLYQTLFESYINTYTINEVSIECVPALN